MLLVIGDLPSKNIGGVCAEKKPWYFMYGAMDIMMTGNSMNKLPLIFISEKVLTRIVLK